MSTSSTPICRRRGCGKPIVEHAIKGRGRNIDFVCPDLPPLIQLIGFGKAPGKPASEVKLGDIILFNYGYAVAVRGVVTYNFASYLDFMVENLNGSEAGKRYTLRKKKATLVPYSERSEDFWRSTK